MHAWLLGQRAQRHGAVLGTGLKEHLIVRNAHASSTFRFRLRVADGERVRIRRDGSVQATLANGTSVGILPAPVARDARGLNVPAWFRLRRAGDTTVLSLHFRRRVATPLGVTAPASYPLDVDPGVYLGTLNVARGIGAHGLDQSASAGASAVYSEGNFVDTFKANKKYAVGDYAEWNFDGPPSGASWYKFTGGLDVWSGPDQK